MGMQFDPSPGPPFCGWGRYEPNWWWLLPIGVALLVGLLWGR
jgi:hypothetical protein